MNDSLEDWWTITPADQKTLAEVTVSHFLAGSRENSYGVLERLSQHPDPKVRALLAGTESTPTQLLSRLATDSDPEVRRAVATNHCTPLSTIELLAKDDNIVMRFGLIEELDISNDILRALVGHSNPYLRKQAYLAMERRELELLLTEVGFEIRPGASYRLGSLLLDANPINYADLEESAAMGHVHGMRLGQAIVQSGLLMKEIVVSYLLKQSLFRASYREP